MDKFQRIKSPIERKIIEELINFERMDYNRYAFNKLFYNNFEVDENGGVIKIELYYNQNKEIPIKLLKT